MSNYNQSATMDEVKRQANDTTLHTHRVLAYGSKTDLETFAAEIVNDRRASNLKRLLDGAQDIIIKSDDHVVALSVQRSSADQELIKGLAAEHPS